MGVVHGLGQRAHQPGRRPRRPGVAAEPGSKATAVHELQGEIRPTLGLADLIDLNDVRVLQACDGLGLDAKTGAAPRVGLRAREHHLQGDDAVQVDLTGLVNDSHAAAAQRGEDLVARDLDDRRRGGGRARSRRRKGVLTGHFGQRCPIGLAAGRGRRRGTRKRRGLGFGGVQSRRRGRVLPKRGVTDEIIVRGRRKSGLAAMPQLRDRQLLQDRGASRLGHGQPVVEGARVASAQRLLETDAQCVYLFRRRDRRWGVQAISVHRGISCRCEWGAAASETLPDGASGPRAFGVSLFCGLFCLKDNSKADAEMQGVGRRIVRRGSEPERARIFGAKSGSLRSVGRRAGNCSAPQGPLFTQLQDRSHVAATAFSPFRQRR